MGLNSILATAGKSLDVFRTGIEVSGQNVANANTPGYVRETLDIAPSPPYEQNHLLIGTGADAVAVRQQIDKFLESQIHRANADLYTARTREEIYKQLESQLNELTDGDLSTAVNDFLAAIHDVVNDPDSASTRQLAIQEGANLAADIRRLAGRVNDMRQAQSQKIEQLVDEANGLIDTIRDLNSRIVRLEASGLNRSDAGALRTQRYAALDRLSQILAIRAVEREGGSVDVYVGNTYLILEGAVQRLEVYSDTDRGASVYKVRLDRTKLDPTTGGGELRGLIEGRDVVLGGFLDRLNTYASNLIFEFNKIHSTGRGLQAHTELTSEVAVDDVTAPLSAAGLVGRPVHGSFELLITNEATGVTDRVLVPVDLDGMGADTSLESLRDAINAAAAGSVSASVTVDGRLRLTAAAGYTFDFANDTSGVLAALQLNPFFVGSDATDIDVSDRLQADHRLFATRLDGGSADNANAVRMAQFLDSPVDQLSGMTLDEYYNATVESVAQGSASESAMAEGFEGFLDSLKNQREQLSGVSLDEEIMLIMNFQNAFQAAARLIRTVDELYTTLLNI